MTKHVTNSEPSWSFRPLETILAPVGLDDFLTNYAQQRYLHIPADSVAPGKSFGDLFDWNSLSQLLNHTPESSTLRLFAGKLNYYYPKTGDNLVKIAEQLRAGQTLILEAIQRYDQTLAVLCDAISHQIAARTAINLYLSQAGYQGYPIHYDTHDFFIFQISGSKHWKIYPSTQDYPLTQPDGIDPSLNAPDESQCLAELTLQPGDVLYLPRGFWHQAQAVSEPSLHLTLGMYLNTGIDYLQWLVQQAKEDPVFRQGFPWVQREAYPESENQPSPYVDHQGILIQQLQQMMQDPLHLHRFHQDSFANFHRYQAFSLPGQFIKNPQELQAVEWFAVRQIPHYFLQIDSQTIELVYPKTKLSFALAARDLLKTILSQTVVKPIELSQQFAEFSQIEMLSVILPLVQDGVLIPQGI